MSDIQAIVARVRGFCAATDQTRTDAMAEMATAFSTACNETNARLRRCVDYLRAGFRSEALRLAELHPNLLEMIASLDIPEIAEWEQLCAMYECARPARIAIEAGAELNEAYMQEQALADLLAEHRFLAMTHGPLDLRLATVRELAAKDASVSFWAEDQEALERIRLIELKPVATAAIKSRSLEAVDRLLNEISAQGWRAPIPDDLNAALKNTSWTLHAELAVEELRLIAEQMRTALQSRSHSKGIQLLSKWKEIVKRYEVEPPPALLEVMLPLKHWVVEVNRQNAVEAQFNEACAPLRSLVDARAPEEALRAQHQILKEFNLSLPEDLERDYQRLIKELVRDRNFKQYGIYAVIGAVVVAVIGVIVVILWSYIKSGS